MTLGESNRFSRIFCFVDREIKVIGYMSML